LKRNGRLPAGVVKVIRDIGSAKERKIREAIVELSKMSMDMLD
jgi:hypothetical protein